MGASAMDGLRTAAWRQTCLDEVWIEESCPVRRLERSLAVLMDREVHVVATRNRSTMISSRQEGPLMRVRVHRMFLDCPDPVLRALAAFLVRGGRRCGAVLDTFIDAQGPRYVALRPAAPVQPVGRVHDLQEIYDDLNHAFFHGSVQARITWGRSGRGGGGRAPRTRTLQGRRRRQQPRRRRTIQLGVYVATERLIRIHPALDQPFVPGYYVGWVVFHEMLHEVFGVDHQGGRACHHPPEFRAVEESYPDFAACRAWEKRYLTRLLAYQDGEVARAEAA